MTKILVIRFSSIGDIVLTTPVLRCLKQQLKNVEIHFLTKKSFAGIIQSNPNVSKVYAIEKEISGTLLKQLKTEKYDHIIDLHHNLRSNRVSLALGTKTTKLNKLNLKKWLLVHFKNNQMPNVHIVDRYLKTTERLGVKNDGLGLDYFIPANDEINVKERFHIDRPYVAIVVGAKHATKQIPVDKIISICNQLSKSVILLGGPEDKTRAQEITKQCKTQVINACGELNLNQSASVLKQSEYVITGDTGLMHIAAAFNKKIISVWGNTVPAFGMYPYLNVNGTGSSHIIEVKNLSCRPCSKIGFDKCPKEHFKCMNEISEKEIIAIANK